MQAQNLELTEPYCILFSPEWETVCANQGAAKMGLKIHMASDGWEILSRAPAPQIKVFGLALNSKHRHQEQLNLINHTHS